MRRIKDRGFEFPLAVHRVKSWLQRRWYNLARWQRVLCGTLAGIMLLAAVIPTVQYFIQSRQYELSAQIRELVGSTDKDLAAKISYDKASRSWLFNKDDIPMDGSSTGQERVDMPTPDMLKASVGGSGKDDESLYAVHMPEDGTQGITYYDTNTRLSFSLVPKFKVAEGREVDGQLVYPAHDGMKVILTAKSNGMKEDIILTKSVGDEVSFEYDLKLPDDLVAKVLDNGGLGVYSADPALYGDFAFGDGQDVEKIKSARETADKDHLLFGIPAPVIKQTGTDKMPAKAKFVKDGTTLRVEARGMSKLTYPVTVDPSVTVTSSTEFGLGVADTNIDFPADQISRGKLTGGSVGSWTSTGSGSYSIHSFGESVIYNGYMYYVGGDTTEVPYAQINSSTGALGTWTTATSLPAVRRYPGVAAYNGYMYVYGGYLSGTTASADVLVATINSDGSLGSWSTAANSMATAACRSGHAVYNGYIYAVAGNYSTVTSNCGNSSVNRLATTQYAKLGAGGTIGTWSTSSNSLSTAVMSPGAAAYNGYLYSIGGTTDGVTAFATIQYTKISATTGDVGAWTTSSWTMASTNYRHAVAAYNGYIYILGGTNNNTRVQYTPVNESGDVGRVNQTTVMSVGRYAAGFAAYNGYLYYMAGSSGTGSLNDAGYATINPPGTLSAPATGGTFTTTRRGLEYINYGNYTYVLGGETSGGGTPIATVYKAVLGSNGDSGTFTSTTSLPANLAYFGAVAYQGYMYAIGGCTSVYSSCPTTANNVATVYKSAINASDGTLGSWTTETSLSAVRYGFQLVAYNGYLYAIGGLNGSTFQSSIEYHAIGASGAISGSWSTSAQSISTARAYHGAAVYGGRLYVSGGCSAGAIVLSCTTFQNDVQYASIGSSGDLSGAFTTNSTSFSDGRSGAELVIAYGNAYVVGGWDGTSYFTDAQTAALGTDGSLGSWTSSTATNNGRAWSGAINVRGYLQVAGGYNGAFLNTVHYSYMNNGGAHRVLSWSSTGSAVSGWANAGGAVYKGYIYQMGGAVSGTATANAKYAQLASDGTVGTWTATSTMNTARNFPAVYVTGGYLYVSGGTNASSALQSSTEYAAINSDGTLGGWSTATAALSTARTGGAYAEHNGYIYYVGGKDGTSDLTSVSYANLSNGGDFSSWSSGTSLPTALYRASAVAYAGYLYVMAGGASDGSSYSDKVYVAAIGGDGSLGSWSLTTTMPTSGYKSTVAYNGILYITGSYNGSYSAVNYFAPLNSSGTVGNWETAPSQSSVDNVAGKSFGYKGYLYHLAAAGSVGYGAPETTPRVGNYSKVIGLGAGYALANISYNGNLPGGKFNINYRTANTDGVFGSLQSSTGLSGSTTTCPVADVAYVLVLVRLDDSGSAVFPDSSSTVANVTDLTVSYGGTRSSPSQRLAHGKYFQDESLQGLDTCGA